MAHFTPDGRDRIDLFDGPAGSIHFVEAGMGQAGNKTSLWPQHAGYLLDGSGCILNIHERHVTNDNIVRAIVQHLQVSCVRYIISNAK